MGEGGRTGGGELRGHALAHDTLQPQARAHKPYTRKRQRIAPRRVPAVRRIVALGALPDAQRGGHGEQRLEERAGAEPEARVVPEAVADAPEEGAAEEGGQRGERLLVGEVEGGVAPGWAGWVLPEAGEGQGELGWNRLSDSMPLGLGEYERTWAELPVWNPTQIKMDENPTTVLRAIHISAPFHAQKICRETRT